MERGGGGGKGFGASALDLIRTRGAVRVERRDADWRAGGEGSGGELVVGEGEE